MKWAVYREKLGIGYDDRQKALLLSKKISAFLEYSALNSRYSTGDLYRFCLLTGIAYEESDSPSEDLALVFQRPEIEHSIKELIAYYVAFVNTQEDISPEHRQELLGELRYFLEELYIPFEIYSDEDGIFVFPKGAEELDDALVSEPLEWLMYYPNARKTYLIALKQYYDGIYIRDVADNLRKALEAFLQEFLGNEKNLETNKNEICKYLGSQGVDAGISGLFQPLLNAYKNINDRIAKHNDAVDKKLLEFLLYQTGVLIRMVITVHKEEKLNEA